VSRFCEKRNGWKRKLIMGKHFNIGDWVRLHRKFGLPKEKPWIVIQYQQQASVYCVRKGDGMLYLYSQTQLELAELPHDKQELSGRKIQEDSSTKASGDNQPVHDRLASPCVIRQQEADAGEFQKVFVRDSSLGPGGSMRPDRDGHSRANGLAAAADR
jgi:hypothetical protein